MLNYETICGSLLLYLQKTQIVLGLISGQKSKEKKKKKKGRLRDDPCSSEEGQSIRLR